jgi:hypothetical protein
VRTNFFISPTAYIAVMDVRHADGAVISTEGVVPRQSGAPRSELDCYSVQDAAKSNVFAACKKLHDAAVLAAAAICAASPSLGPFGAAACAAAVLAVELHHCTEPPWILICLNYEESAGPVRAGFHNSYPYACVNVRRTPYARHEAVLLRESRASVMVPICDN